MQPMNSNMIMEPDLRQAFIVKGMGGKERGVLRSTGGRALVAQDRERALCDSSGQSTSTESERSGGSDGLRFLGELPGVRSG